MKNILLLSFLSIQFSFAQNLVPNSSFEEYVECPNFTGNVDSVCNEWTSFRGTPDYFNNCSSNMGYHNGFGYQLPRTGEAYTGFINYQTSYAYTEQIGAELTHPLEIGSRYYTSFYVSAGYDGTARVLASNKIGIRFTTYPFSTPNGTSILPNNCQIFTNTIITDTINWIQVSGSFVADSAYRYAIIGGFFDQLHTDTVHMSSDFLGQSYYFLDDVCVSTDPTLCGVDTEKCDFVLPTAFTPNGDNRNDKYKCVTNCNNVETFSMRIYNRWGLLVFNANKCNIGWNGEYNNEEQPVDVYMVYASMVSNGKQISKSTSMTLLR